MKAFRRACMRLGYRCNIIGTDTTELSAALQCCDRKYIVEPVTHRNYASRVMGIAEKEKVDLFIPTVDLDLHIWAQRRKKLSNMGCSCLISSPRVIKITQDKRLCYDFLCRNGFDTPETTTAAELLRQKNPRIKPPYFLKPWDGHASRGSVAAYSVEELKFYAGRIPNCLVQELIVGKEHTVDVLVDFEGKVRCVVPRRREEVRAGEVSKGVTVKHPEIMQQSKRLVEKLGAGPGVITIQCFLTRDEQVKFIEINPRFGGGVPLSIKAGANFPLWILQLWQGQKPDIKLDGWRDGLVMLRYDDEVWLRQ